MRYRISPSRISNMKRREQLQETERLCNFHRAKRGLLPITVNIEYDRWCRREHFVKAALKSGYLHTAAWNLLILVGAGIRTTVVRLKDVLRKLFGDSEGIRDER